MSLRKQPRTVSDHETLTAVIEGTRHGRMPGLLNKQAGYYALAESLDGVVVFQPSPPHSQDYAARISQGFFDLGIVSVLSRRNIA